MNVKVMKRSIKRKNFCVSELMCNFKVVMYSACFTVFSTMV